MDFKAEWFNDGEFWERFAPIIFDEKRWAEVAAVTSGVGHLARLNLYGDQSRPSPSEGGPRLLDLCCGMGRLTAEFARLGFRPTGVDITQIYLEAARDDAAYEKLPIEYIREDVRSFKRPSAFDVAVNLYVSFGYFENPAHDRLLAKNAFESLKPGGCFIIETLGKELAVRDFIEREWFERAGFTVLTEYEPLDSWSALKNRWILIDQEGRRFEKVLAQRLYAASELRALLLDTGFSSVELYGSWNEAPYNERAEILIAVGRKGF